MPVTGGILFICLQAFSPINTNKRIFPFNLVYFRIFKRLANALMRLCVCAGWSEPLLVAHTTLLEISCRDSYVLAKKQENKMAICLLFSQLVVDVGKVILYRHIYSLCVLGSYQIR